jgi:restriction system protein
MEFYKNNVISVPYFDFNLLIIKALLELGGSGSKKDIKNKIYRLDILSEKVIYDMHNNETEVNKELEYSLNYLMNFGFINKSSKGIWSFKKYK